jgi:hypothetical protein
MLARNLFHTFVYRTVWGAANIYWFPTFMDWMLPFSSTLRKEKKRTTPTCAFGPLRLMCTSLCSWSIGIKQLPSPRNHFDRFRRDFLGVTSLHHIHDCGVHDICGNLCPITSVWACGSGHRGGWRGTH